MGPAVTEMTFDVLIAGGTSGVPAQGLFADMCLAF